MLNIKVKLINLISKFSEKGLSPSQIGLILRDSFSIIDVKNITGFNILKILKLKVKLVLIRV